MSAWQFKDLLRNETRKLLIFNFNSLSFSHPSSLQIIFTITWLHQIDPSLPSMQRNSCLKESYGTHSIFTPELQKFTCGFQWLLTANSNPERWDDSIRAITSLAVFRRLWFPCKSVTEERSAKKQKRRFTRGMSSHKRGGCHRISGSLGYAEAY